MTSKDSIFEMFISQNNSPPQILNLFWFFNVVKNFHLVLLPYCQQKPANFLVTKKTFLLFNKIFPDRNLSLVKQAVSQIMAQQLLVIFLSNYIIALGL